MIINELKELADSGKLKLYVSKGIIPVKIMTQYNIYLYYLIELEINRREKNCVMQSVSNTADKFKCVDMTVFRAIKFCQSL
ncbi:hypothetical protein UFOVP606_6 [uncultured Caudovirales phage]|uniref:Uncharacterized protein n=1 Tax=uncultured Caudovirales phage TaxID=2100421 RepID=A0A6J5N2Y5_9CAUD|nr:hypothetical protein UFOVP606_6 [uncultured Caudovirales phage]